MSQHHLWLAKEHWEGAESFSDKERGKGRETEVIIQL